MEIAGGGVDRRGAFNSGPLMNGRVTGVGSQFACGFNGGV